MSELTLLIRPDLGYKPYRLKCRFIMPKHPSVPHLMTAKVEAAELFVRDMAKQGWEYLDKHDVTLPDETANMCGTVDAACAENRECRFSRCAHQKIPRCVCHFHDDGRIV